MRSGGVSPSNPRFLSEERRGGRLPPSSLAVILFLLFLLAPLTIVAAGFDDESEKTHIGLIAGTPQLVALTAERTVSSPVRVQLHASYVIMAYSAGARAVVELDPGWGALRPFAFAGGGYLCIVGEEGRDDFWDGHGFFAWAGGGLRLRLGRFTLGGEIGAMNWRSTYNTVRYPGDRKGETGSIGLSVAI